MPLVKDLPIGAKIKFGSYRVDKEEPHRICWLKVHNDNTFITEFIEDQLHFDVREPDNPDRHRRDCGSNRYSTSNIDQYLNGFGKNWYKQKTEYDVPPADGEVDDGVGYVNKPGFLSLFESWEIENILPTKITTLLSSPDRNTVDEDGRVITTETIIRNVFLPSRSNFISDKNTEESQFWDLFRNGGSRGAMATEECCRYSIASSKPSKKEFWYFLLRTPGIDHGHQVGYMSSNGSTGNHYADATIVGCRPCLRLAEETMVSEDCDRNGYYEVLEPLSEQVVITEEEFLSLFKV